MPAITQTRTWDTLLSTTMDSYAPKMWDNASSHIALLFALAEAGNLSQQPGGAQLVVPLLTGLNNTAAFYADGDTLNVSAQQGIQAAAYLWKQLAVSVVIYGGEMMRNQSPHQAINLVTAKIEQAERGLWDVMDNSSVGLFSSVGDGLTGFSGLQSLISTTPSTRTVGNISGADNAFWRNQVGTAVTDYSAHGIARLRALYYTCVRGLDHPNLIVTDRTTYTNHLAALTGSIQYHIPYGPPLQNTRYADVGITNVQFEGAPMIFDANCPAGNVYMINTNVLQLIGMEGRTFTNSPFIARADQDTITARILFMGELVMRDAQRLGVLTGANND